jgi:hypothetical protein
MDSKVATKKFCSVLQGFLSDMYMSYPDISLSILMKATDAMIMTNPSSVVENFNYCIEPYSEKILARDDSFFLDGGLNGDLETGNYSFLTDELNKIVEIWNNPSTTSKTKNAIWKYFEILVKLSVLAK